MARRLGVPIKSLDVKSERAAVNDWFTTVTERFNKYSGPGNPTTADVPENQWIVWKNTNTNALSIWLNDGGSLVQSTFYGFSSGTVSSFAFTNANGITGVVSNPTTTPNLTLSLGAITPTSITSNGGALFGNVIGYRQTSSIGGTVTQLTSKSTGVTLNKVTGQITMNSAALAAGAFVSFTVTNSFVNTATVPYVAVASGGTTDAYHAFVTAVATGSFNITVQNITGGPLSESPVISFNLIQGSSN
jgi:hypothetical protein